MQIRNNPGEALTARREAEEALLGSLLIEATATSSLAVKQCQSLINHMDFLDATWGKQNQHSRIFQAMTKCDHPEIVTVAQKMAELGTLQAGDCAYLSHLISECPCSLDYLHYAKAVRKYSRGTETDTKGYSISVKREA